MSVVKISLSDPARSADINVRGTATPVNVRQGENAILQSLALVAWQEAKTRKEFNATQALVDECEGLKADSPTELSLSREDVDRLAEAYLSISGERRPEVWRIVGRELLKQIMRSE